MFTKKTAELRAADPILDVLNHILHQLSDNDLKYDAEAPGKQ